MAKRIGLLGGTFDPVHYGHIAIADSFISSQHLDELWIILTPYPPHKEEGNYTSYDVRLKMLQAAFSDHTDEIKISTTENNLPKPSFTVNTIKELKKVHPDYEFLFCLGEDSLEKFHTWKFYEQIIEEVMLLAALRPGASHEKVDDEVLKRTIFIVHEPYEISSSEIRDKVINNEDILGCVPKKVAEVITNEQLYTQTVGS